MAKTSEKMLLGRHLNLGHLWRSACFHSPPVFGTASKRPKTMDPQDAVDLSRDALMIATLVSAPVLVAGMVVGLVIGLLQALTQIQEQTVAFVPKLVAMVLALTFALPWILTRLLEYTEELITNIPEML